MTTVTLYHWQKLNSVPGWEEASGFSLEFCGSYGFYNCDDGKDYILPGGYTFEESNAGSMEFYDCKGKLATLENGSNLPVIRSQEHPAGITLRLVESAVLQ